MLLDSFTEEQITDNQQVQDSLLILLRFPPAAKIPCNCNHCRRLNRIGAMELERPGGQYGPDEIPQLGGKLTTKIRRD